MNPTHLIRSSRERRGLSPADFRRGVAARRVGARLAALPLVAATAMLFAGLAIAAPRPRAAPAPPDSARVMALLDGVLNATCPLRGVATGGQIDGAHVKGLSKSGFRTILDLRGEDEPRGFGEAQAVRGAGLDYVLIPITGATLDDRAFARIRAFMNDAAHYPVMVHCASGNRVGVVLLPWLVLDRGWKLSDAVTMAEQGGMRAGPMREMALDYIERQRAKR